MPCDMLRSPSKLDLVYQSKNYKFSSLSVMITAPIAVQVVIIYSERETPWELGRTNCLSLSR